MQVFDPQKALAGFEEEDRKKEKEKVFNPQKAAAAFAREDASIASKVGLEQSTEETAKIIDLSSRSGLSKEVVQTDPKSIERRLKENDVAQAAEKHPVFGRWMSEPENVSLVQDELPIWSAISEASDFTRSLGSGGVSIGTGFSGLADINNAVTNKLTGLLPDGMEKPFREFEAKLNDSIPDVVDRFINPSRVLRGGGEAFRAIADFIRPEDQGFFDQVAEGLGQLGAQVVLAVLTGGTSTTVLMAGQGADQLAQKGRAEGATREELDNAVLLGATVTAASEKIGLDKLLDRFPPAIKNKIGQKIADIFIGGGIEAAQEAVESILHDVVETFTFDEDQPIGGEAAQEGAVAFVVGAIMRGLTAGRLRNVEKAEKAQDHSERLKELFTKLDEAELFDKNDAKGRELFQSIMDGNAQGELNINASGLASAVVGTGDPEAISQLIRKLGIDQETFDTAVKTGNDISVKAGALSSLVRGDETIRNAVLMNVRADDDAMTMSEAEVAMAEAKQAIEDDIAHQQDVNEEQQILQRPVEAVFEMVKSQLLSTGRFTSEAASTNAELHRGIANILQGMHDRAGVEFNAFQFVQEMGFNINDETQAREQKTRNIVLDSKLNEIRKRKDKSGVKDLFDYMIEGGRVKSGGTFAGELMNMGITPKSRVGLFSNKGEFGDGDNIVASEFNERFGVTAKEDGNGYVDRDWLLERIGAGSFNSEMDNFSGELMDEIDRLEINLNEQSNEEIINILNQDVKDQTDGDGGVLYQQTLEELLALFEDISSEKPQSIFDIKSKVATAKEFRDRFNEQYGERNDRAAWTDARLRNAIATQKHANGKESKGRIGFIDPLDFLMATGVEVYDKISKDAGTLDKTKLADEQQTPFLMIDNDHEIVGHEGRHRMIAMAKAGVSRVPVLIMDRSYADRPYKKSDLFRGQIYEVRGGGGNVYSENIKINDLFPALSSEFKNIKEAMRQDKAEVLFQEAGNVNSDAFTNWFKESVAVNEDGSPQKLYHGTTKDFKSFNPKAKSGSASGSRGAIFVSPSPEFASGFAEVDDGGQIMPVYISLQNPAGQNLETAEAIFNQAVDTSIEGSPQNLQEFYDRVDSAKDSASRKTSILNTFQIKAKPEYRGNNGLGSVDHNLQQMFLNARDNPQKGFSNFNTAQTLGDIIKDAGFDGYIETEAGVDNFAVFEPTQVKSIFNKGTYDSKDSRTLYQKATDAVKGIFGGKVQENQVDALPDLEKASDGPIPAVVEMAKRYAEITGRPHRRQANYVKIDVPFAERIAQAFDEMADTPTDPETLAAYNQMIDETIAQFKVIQEGGLEIDFIPDGSPDPYTDGPKMAIEDMRNNNHLWVFPTTGGFGTVNEASLSNPLLRETDIEINGHKLLANDVFRIVHDVFGHGLEGARFGARGEENAWQAHVRMYSPLAARAMTTETRGQNSWVNFGTYGENNRKNPKETVYADQKIGLLPEWASNENVAKDQEDVGRTVRGRDSREGTQETNVSEQSQVEQNRSSERTGRENREIDVPPIEANGKLRLLHFSNVDGIQETDPDKFGSNQNLSSRSGERIRKYQAGFKPRTYFAIGTGLNGGYKHEAGVGQIAYETEIDPKTLYDLADDPKKFRATFNTATEVENAIIDAGFKGYWRKHPSIGMVAAIFEKVPVTKTDRVKDERILYQSTTQATRDNIGLYSQVEQAVLDMDLPTFKPSNKNPEGRALGSEIYAKLTKTNGVKAEEIKWLGIEEYLLYGNDGTGGTSKDVRQTKFTRDEVVKFIKQNGVEIVENVGSEEKAGESELRFDDGEVWDDHEAWEYDVEEFVNNPEEYGFDNDTERQILINELIDRDDIEGDTEEEQQAYVEENYADEINDALTDRIQEWAEETAQERYFENPVYIYEAETDEGSIYIFGNDDVGYDVRRDNWRSGGNSVADDIWSLGEAQIQAQAWARENDYLRSEDDTNVAHWGDPEYNMEGDYSNYRELKLGLPDVSGDFYKKDHFADRNVVAFLRVDDRKLPHREFIEKPDVLVEWELNVLPKKGDGSFNDVRTVVVTDKETGAVIDQWGLKNTDNEALQDATLQKGFEKQYSDKSKTINHIYYTDENGQLMRKSNPSIPSENMLDDVSTVSGRTNKVIKEEIKFLRDDLPSTRDKSIAALERAFDKSSLTLQEIADKRGYPEFVVNGVLHLPDHIPHKDLKTKDVQIDLAYLARDNGLFANDDLRDEALRFSNYTARIARLEGELVGNRKAYLDNRKAALKRARELKTYFIDEFQSDWHQTGRKKGYSTGADAGLIEQDGLKVEREAFDKLSLVEREFTEKAFPDRVIKNETDFAYLEFRKILREFIKDGREEVLSTFEKKANRSGEGGFSDATIQRAKEELRQAKLVDELVSPEQEATLKEAINYKLDQQKLADAERDGVPDAPFKGNGWINLGLKRAIVDAVENGYEAIAWPNSSVLADRWSEAYRELYKVQYDTKMPSMVQKLTKQTPKEFNLDGEPMGKLSEKVVQLKEMFEEDGTIYLSRGRSLKKADDGVDLFKNGSHITTYSDIDDALDQQDLGEFGYFIIEITPELRERVKLGAFPLFQKQGDEVRGKFNPDTATISFTKHSDKTSFLHESGHLFFEMIDRAADLPNAPDELIAMREEMYRITGYDSLKSFEENRVPLEHFAEQFEAYLETGKAPSKRLRKAFNTFRRWIIDAYKKLKGQLPDLQPEMKSFFDRMLATQEEIDEAEAETGLLVPEILSSVIDPEDNKRILEIAEEAHNEGYQKQYEQRLKYEKRTATKAWKNQLNEERGKAHAELLNNKIYRNRHYLMSGEFPTGETPATMKGLKINKQSLIDEFGVGVTKTMKKLPRAMSAEGGIHVDEMAEILGYGTAKEMLEGLVYADGIKKATNKLADQRMLEIHGDPLNDGTMEENAIAHVAMDKRSAFLEAQTKALEKKATKKNKMTPLKVIRKTIQEALQGKELKKVLTPRKFLQASIRAGKRSEAALASGDIDTAFNEKQRQLVNYEMFRAADEMKTVVDRMFKWQDRLAKKSISRTLVDPEYIKQLKNFAIGAGNPLQAGQGMTDAIIWAEARMKEERDIPSNLLIPYDQEGITSVDDRRNWTFEQAKQANDFLKSMWKEGRGASNEEKARLEAIDGELATRIEDNVKGEYKPKTGKTPAGKAFNKFVDGYFSGHVAADQFMRQMDGYEEQGYVWETFKGKAADMENAEIELKEVKIPQLHQIFRKYYSKKEMAQNTYKKVALSAPIYENDHPVTHITKIELLVLALNVGNPYGLEVLSKGYGVEPDVMMKILDDAMLEKDWKLAKDIGDYLGEFWPDIKALEERVTGVAPEQVEVHDVVTKFGTFGGWYYPLVYDADLSGKSYVNMQAQQMKDLMGGSYGRAATKHGHTTARTNSGGQSPLLSLSVLYNHVNNVIHDLSHREGVLELNRIMHGKDFQKATVKKLGLPAWNQMNNWLKEIAGGEVQPHAALDVAFRYIRTASTVIGLGARLSTMAVQPLGFTSSILRLGLKDTVKGVRKFYSSPAEGWAFIADRSPFMRNRMNNFDRDVALISSDTELSWVDVLIAKSGLPAPRAQEIAAWSFKGIAVLDMFVAAPTWMGAYHQGLADFKGDEAKAIKHADAVVVESQGGGGNKDLVGIQRGTELQRMFTMFFSYFIRLHQLMREQTKKLGLGKINAFQYGTALLVGYVIPSVLDGIMRGDLPDDEEDYPLWFAKRVAGYAGATMVGSRDISNALFGDYGYSMTPVQSSISTAVSSAELGKKAFDGEDITDADIAKVVKSVGLATKLPLDAPYKEMLYLKDVLNGEEELTAKGVIFNKREK